MSAKVTVLNKDHDTINEEFMTIALNISEMLQAEGKTVRPFVPGLPHFSKLSTDRKLHIIQQVRFYQELCQSQLSEGFKINDNFSFTWRAFGRLGLSPSKDFFSYVQGEDIIEIYSKDQIQLFRNFAFFDCCSYTLEELHSYEWWTLFERDEKHTQMILEDAAKTLSGEIRETFTPNIPVHTLREANSAENFLMNIEIRCMAPVYRNKKVDGLIVLERASFAK